MKSNSATATVRSADEKAAETFGGSSSRFQSGALLEKVQSLIEADVDGNPDVDERRKKHSSSGMQWQRLVEGEEKSITEQMRETEHYELIAKCSREWIEVAPLKLEKSTLERVGVDVKSGVERLVLNPVSRSLYGSEMQSFLDLYGNELMDASLSSAADGPQSNEDEVDPLAALLDYRAVMRNGVFPQGPAASAFLRIILALLHYGSDDVKAAVVKDVRKPAFLAALLRLGRLACWCAYDIGSMILMILQYFLEMPMTRGLQDSSYVIMYESSVDILHSISNFFNLRLCGRKTPLSRGEEIFSVHSCRTWNLIARQIFHVKFFDTSAFDEHVRPREKVIIREMAARRLLSELFEAADLSALVRLIYYYFRPTAPSSSDAQPQSSQGGSASTDVPTANSFSSFEDRETSSVSSRPLFSADLLSEGRSEKDVLNAAIRESVGQAISEIIAVQDRRDQYAVLEVFNRLAIEEGSTMRGSFFQAILDTVQGLKFEHGVEKMLIGDFTFQEDERVLRAAWLTEHDWRERLIDTLFVLSNQKIYFLQRTTKNACSVCPPENFCPLPPKVTRTISYSDVATLKQLYGGYQFTIHVESEGANVVTQFIGKLTRPDFYFSTSNRTHLQSFISILRDMCRRVQSVGVDCRPLDAIKKDVNVKEEPILFFGNVVKVNHKGRPQSRVLAISSRGVYNFIEMPGQLAKLGTKFLSLRKKYSLSDLVRFEENDSEEIGVPRLMLRFSREKKGKTKDSFFDVIFGCDNAREEAKAVLLRLLQQGSWKVGVLSKS